MATYNEGYYTQTSVTQEADLGSTGLYYVGIPTEEGKPIITIGLAENLKLRDVMGQYYQEIESGLQLADRISLDFVPTNSRFLYWMLGKRTTSTGTRTISNMDGSARKPRLSVWKQVNNDKRHAYGVVFESMSLNWENNQLNLIMSGKGMAHGTDAYSPSITHEGSISTVWNHMESMTWDGDTLVPYKFSGQITQPITPMIGYAGHYQEINEFAPIGGTYNLIVSATNGEAMLTDFESQTPKDFIWTVKKADDNTKSMTFTHTNCRIRQINATEIIGYEPIYNVLLQIEGISVAVTDGV